MQLPQYTPMKKMEVDLRPLDEVEEKKANEGAFVNRIVGLDNLLT